MASRGRAPFVYTQDGYVAGVLTGKAKQMPRKVCGISEVCG
ncbi:hypothetical protein FHS43_000456 [Streptosporangium becharense]|uniref:Uncharacterized protein n=1 Tax=Streptosporangium becharense TaxID=1816182 RepID=A0A7W9IGA1_9ACTN|nr:hypothetical protein [Streptosporangium becharense]MBB2909210.1 hypothetical protein [Streptosporangium becharense]MBB5819771.1 hypothetical protein [Streptosporangium becharense]